VLEQEPVKVPPRDSSFLGAAEMLPATLPKEAQDSLTLETRDGPFFPASRPSSRDRDSRGFLQVKG